MVWRQWGLEAGSALFYPHAFFTIVQRAWWHSSDLNTAENERDERTEARWDRLWAVKSSFSPDGRNTGTKIVRYEHFGFGKPQTNNIVGKNNFLSASARNLKDVPPWHFLSFFSLNTEAHDVGYNSQSCELAKTVSRAHNARNAFLFVVHVMRDNFAAAFLKD